MTPLKSVRGIIATPAIITVIVGAGFGLVYSLSERILDTPREAPLVPLHPPSDPDPPEGERMARIVGCWNGCHGPRGEGGYEEIAGIVWHTAPMLSQVVPLYSDEELVRLVRFGVKRDGKSAVGMTSYTLWALGDQDLANIITHLRRQLALPVGKPASDHALRARTISRQRHLLGMSRLGVSWQRLGTRTILGDRPYIPPWSNSCILCGLHNRSASAN